MKNSLKAAGYFMTLFPQDQSPETTDGWEGYLHPYNLKGEVEETTVKVLLRDFKDEGLAARKQLAEELRSQVVAKFPDIEVELELKDYYKNMKTVLDQYPEVMETAMEACRRAGVEPILKNVRGGTDGARLCFEGLPTPNIFDGGFIFHGKKELPLKPWYHP